MNHGTKNALIYMNAWWHIVQSILLNSLSAGVGRGHNRVNHFYICWIGIVYKKISFQETTGFKFTQIYLEADLMQNQVDEAMVLGESLEHNKEK
jgi:hypothetical protein